MSAYSRPFDIVAFGSTGFAGKKLAEYLASRMPEGGRWAIAGRRRDELERIKKDLRAPVEVIVADVADFDSLLAMARQARVLVTTVGPFLEHGDAVVRACIHAGTDYLDSTGEAAFVNLLLERHFEEAREKNLRIVPSCAFDSVIADLGALFTVLRLPPGAAVHLSGYLSLRMRSSGGTQQSAVLSFGSQKTAISAWREPTTSFDRRVTLVPGRLHREASLRGWAVPVPMVCAATVVRSAASNPRYGSDFTYRHHLVLPWLPLALIAQVFVAFLSWAGRFAAVRLLLRKIAKKSGKGPNEAQMDRGWFVMRFIGESAGKVVRTEVSGGDPGYRESAKILAESALCLAYDRHVLPDARGILTPAQAMGDTLRARLDAAGLRFSSDDTDLSNGHRGNSKATSP